MNAKELLKRKFRLGWSDLQFLVLLELGERGRLHLMELVEATGASTTGVWNALTNPTMESFILKDSRDRRPFYRLTKAGMRALAQSLMHETPAERKAAPGSVKTSFRRNDRGSPPVAMVRGFLC